MLQEAPRVPWRPTQVKVGTVVSDKMDKTIVVKVTTTRRHPLYGHVQRLSRTFMVHDEENSAHLGDEVRFCLCRPISRHKSWILMEITRPSRSTARFVEENTTDYRAAEDEEGAELAESSE